MVHKDITGRCFKSVGLDPSPVPPNIPENVLILLEAFRMAHIDCPICSRTLVLEDSHKGRKVRCAGCETRMRFRPDGSLELLSLKDGSKPTAKPNAPAATGEKSEDRFSEYDDVIRLAGYIAAAAIVGMLFLLFLLNLLPWWLLFGGVMAMGVLIGLLPLLKIGKGLGIKSEGVAKGLQVAKGIQKSIDTLKSELPKAFADSSKPKADPPKMEEAAKKSEDPGEEIKDVPTQTKDDPGEETKDVSTETKEEPGEETNDVPTQRNENLGEETKGVPTQGKEDPGEDTRGIPTQSENDPGEDTRPVPTAGS